MAHQEFTYRSTTYRLLPRSRAKHDLLMRLTVACIFVWNHFLAKNEREWRWHEAAPWVVDAPSVSFFGLGKEFTKLRGRVEWLRELPANPVKHTLKRQSEAWSRYFKGGGRPRFKSRHGSRSVTFPEPTHFKILGKGLYLQKLGWFKVSRRGGDTYAGFQPHSVTVKRECGKWYAIILYRVPVEDPLVAKNDNGRSIGVDMNVGQVATSGGEILYMPDMGRLEARKRRYQRRLARQVKGSNRRAVTKLRLAKTCRNIRNVRHDWHHSTSRHIVEQASVVIVENLNTKGMTKSAKGTKERPGTNVSQKRGLNRSITNTGWASLKWMLAYKAHELVEVPAHYTSQACSRCGFVDKGNRKTQSKFACLACGHEGNADVNAALNISALGSGATGRGGGGSLSRPVKRQDMSGVAVGYSCIQVPKKNTAIKPSLTHRSRGLLIMSPPT